ncbi:MAG: hypothetical protein ACT4N2_01475 [Hyphomicrobium sp.]
MKRVFVEATEDETRPQGGHVVILIQGLEAVSDRPMFRLKPLDGSFIPAKRTTQRSNLLTPVTTRLTENGVELVVGPEIVEHPLLLAGTPVVIELPDAGVRGEFLWPSVAPTAQPRRRTVVGMRKARGQASELDDAHIDTGRGEGGSAADLALMANKGEAAMAGVPGSPSGPPQPALVADLAGSLSDGGGHRSNGDSSPDFDGHSMDGAGPVRIATGKRADSIHWQGRQAANRMRRKRWLAPGLAVVMAFGLGSYYLVSDRPAGSGLMPANAQDTQYLPSRKDVQARAADAKGGTSSGIAGAGSTTASGGTKVAAVAPGNTGNAVEVCEKPEISTDPLDGGRMRIRIAAPCKGNEDVRLGYAGSEFVHRLDPGGSLELEFDCFAGPTFPVEIRFGDGRTRSLAVVATDFARLSKVAVVWRAPVNLDLHAFEYAAERGEKGPVHEHAPGTWSSTQKDVEGSGRGRGFMSATMGARGQGDKVEVYTFYHSDHQAAGAVDLALDYETRGENPAAGTCGTDEHAEIPFRLTMLVRGQLTLQDQGRIAAASCGGRLSADVRFDRHLLPVLKVRK